MPAVSHYQINGLLFGTAWRPVWKIRANPNQKTMKELPNETTRPRSSLVPIMHSRLNVFQAVLDANWKKKGETKYAPLKHSKLAYECVRGSNYTFLFSACGIYFQVCAFNGLLSLSQSPTFSRCTHIYARKRYNPANNRASWGVLLARQRIPKHRNFPLRWFTHRRVKTLCAFIVRVNSAIRCASSVFTPHTFVHSVVNEEDEETIEHWKESRWRRWQTMASAEYARRISISWIFQQWKFDWACEVRVQNF